MSVSGTSFGFPDFSSDFPDFTSGFPVFLRHIASDHRAVVAGNVLGKIGYRADGFHRYRE